MNESKSDDQLFAKHERIFRLLCEAVNESPSIKDYSEYPQSSAYFYRQWTLDEEDRRKSFAYQKEKQRGDCIDLFKFQSSKDIILLIHYTQVDFTYWHEISLIHIAGLLYMVAEDEVDKPEVKKIFDVNSAQEREEAIDLAVKSVLKRFFWALPNLLVQATNRAIHDSILSYIKTDVEHTISLHWKKLELPRNYEYLPHDLLDLFNRKIKRIEDWRQRFIGNIREISEPELSKIPGRYKELSKAYNDVKKEYHQKKRKFLAASNRRTFEDWREQWKKEFVYYPALYPDCLMLIYDDEMIMPRQLAYQHLSFDWGYSPDHMRRIINKQKAKTCGRNKKSGASR